MDTISTERRSEIMRLVRSRDTRPEVQVRRLIHGLGYRFRLQARELPGTPDIVFRPRRKAVFVNGCFWHGHDDCALARTPKSRIEFWSGKFAANRSRDSRVKRELRLLGYRTMTVWECELGNPSGLARRIARFLDA